MLTVVVENSWQTAFTALLSVSGLQRTSQRVRVEIAPDAIPAGTHAPARTRRQQRIQRLPALPGGRLGPRCRGATRQLPLPLVGRLRRRGHGHPAGRACRPPPQAGVLARIPPLLLLHGEAAGSRIRASCRAWAPSTGSFPDLEHDVALRACELAEAVVHLPEVLCHRLLPPAGPRRRRRARCRPRHGRPRAPGRGGGGHSRPGPGHLSRPATLLRRAEHHHHHSLSRRTAVHARLHRVDRRHPGHRQGRFRAGRQRIGAARDADADRATGPARRHRRAPRRAAVQLVRAQQCRRQIGDRRRVSLSQQ